ncbi:MarR family transcriptional regulator [Sedimentibacter sp. MB35-C1]|uniref:MarR family winged helix-turn-helix transcriptional regulator n=1 Tax=Sedimentibacter sp. MB35-C1 TaxID=3070995 RepID=UPI0027E1BABD|nr:MarR family transcriptional regulator [Sedimentibacter sp. MB35-C1]WMJ75790.1 MarR family transcriptional regulator [Sedimentibacter sp. MB35-C1]
MKDLGVTRVQWIALYYLGKDEFISQKELAERMSVKESSVARLLDRMERDGLVERVRSEEDKRVINLRLTEKGRQRRAKLVPEGEKFERLLHKNISDEDMKIFTMVLSKMVNNILEENMDEKCTREL